MQNVQKDRQECWKTILEYTIFKHSFSVLNGTGEFRTFGRPRAHCFQLSRCDSTRQTTVTVSGRRAVPCLAAAATGSPQYKRHATQIHVDVDTRRSLRRRSSACAPPLAFLSFLTRPWRLWIFGGLLRRHSSPTTPQYSSGRNEFACKLYEVFNDTLIRHGPGEGGGKMGQDSGDDHYKFSRSVLFTIDKKNVFL